MARFITINDSIISSDLLDLEILSYPGPDPLLLSSDDVPGRFVLKVSEVTYSSLQKEGFVPRFSGEGVRRFNLAVCHGSPNSKVTWKPALTCGDCVFLIGVDRDEGERFQDEYAPRLDDGPIIYSLQGIFYRTSGWLMEVSEVRVKDATSDRTTGTITVEQNDLIWRDLTINHAIHHLLKWSEEEPGQKDPDSQTPD